MAYPEEIEETKSIIQLASPTTLKNEMAPPNYKIGNVNVPAREKGPLQFVAETAGANVVGKAGEAALFGVPEAGQAIGTGGIWSKLAPEIAKGAGMVPGWGWALAGLAGLAASRKNKGGAVGPLGAQYKEPGGKIPFEKRPHNKEEEFKRKYGPSMLDNMLNLITGKSIDQQAIDAKVHTAMTDYYGTPYYNRLMLEDEAKKFMRSTPNENIGRQYFWDTPAANHPSGGMIDIVTDDANAMSFRRPLFEHEIYAGPLAPLADDKREMVRRMQHSQGFNKGGNVQHKEHGGMMTGPLSNNKSVKMEKK